MKIVAANHAETLRSRGSESNTERMLLETIGDGLRAFYGDAAPELPSALLSAALRLDVMREPPVFTG